MTSARPRARRHGIPAVAAGVAALALAGCGGLPGSSDVMVGRRVDDQVAPAVRVVVPPPQPGAPPEQIVRGFLSAGAALQEPSDGDEPVGNAFLTRASVPRWRPTSAVTVFDRLTVAAVQQRAADVWVASVAAVATIDDAGRYREVPPGTVVSVELRLVRVAGEWRIELPDSGFGVWLNTDDFGRVFAPHRLHYPAAGPGRQLVADVRWFPAGPRLVTAVARAQLGPVPDYLKGAVDTGFPEGVRLAVDAVPVVAGVATVALTNPAAAADLAHRREMWAQLAATLTALPGVSGVVIEVQGQGRLSLPEGVEIATGPADVGWSAAGLPRPRIGLLRLGEQFQRVDLARLEDAGDPVPSAAPGPTSASPPGPAVELPTLSTAYPAVAVSAQWEVAAVAASRSELVRIRGRTQVPVEQVATDLVRPAYDALGRLWIAGRAAGMPGLWTIDATEASARRAEPIEVPWLGSASPVSLAVSRDGTRIALITEGPDGQARLEVAGVVRDGGGRPLSLSRPLRQGEPLARLVDVVWIDDTKLAVLGSVGAAAGEPVRTFIVPLGEGVGLRRVGLPEPSTSLARPVDGARWLVPTSGERGVVVVAEPPAVLLRVGGLWRRAGSATGLAVPPVG